MKQELHMVTGKGGVGKSVFALALAEKFAASGESTLLVELGDSSYFGPLLGLQVDSQPQAVSGHLQVVRLNGEDCLREYVSHLVKVPRITDLFFNNKVMRAFIRAAPGLKELAILGKLTSGLRNWGPAFPYRHVVVDSYASGHFVALLKAPVGMAQVIDMGPMGEQSRAISKTLRDQERVHFEIVCLPEEMPTVESVELFHELNRLTGQTPTLWMNKMQNLNLPASSANSPKWEVELHQFTADQQIKVSKSLSVLKDANIPYLEIPFIYEVSPRAVADGILKEGLE